ncbi:hypothetical protein [Demequina mangrovi]|uniref:PknH-like extracellular domain-containing protein n=1 Tax=Demequina mangrovi TaxID=1043493 RepID=A0A1H6ZLC9_9MICO|nr:hypothetical protein [Demequina mangrovi]SEJ50390.1 hypothetical protein SAMN05421637_2047 [Demequina mangrovi]
MTAVPMRLRAGLVVTAAACALAACDPSETGEPGGSPTPSAVGDVAAPDPVDDPVLKRHLAEFDREVEIAGMGVPADWGSPVDSASGYLGGGTIVVEPAACAELDQAIGLGTDADRTAAAGDIVNPVGPFFPGGVEPTDAPPEAGVAIVTRVFADEALAASVLASLLEADCDAYATTSTWDGGSSERSVEIVGVDEVVLDGLGAATVRIGESAESFVLYDEDGSVENEGDHDPSRMYVHVEGPYAIRVMIFGVDDEEAVVADVIATFLAHMAQA